MCARRQTILLQGGLPRPMACEASCSALGGSADGRLVCGSPVPSPGTLRVGTWNVSHWSGERAVVVSQDIGFDVLAVQETHLAVHPLERARSQALSLGIHLHHGRPVRPVGSSDHGKSCGVGFVAAPGVALSPVAPVGAAWRMLHALCRIHAVSLPPRSGLPHGLLLISTYAPLPNQQLERTRFDLAFQELCHTLDMQRPTLLLGDFNGTLNPASDYQAESGRRRPPCPLLAALLGPGAPWVDVQASLLQPPLAWTYTNIDSRGRTSASRIDLILANQAALRLITSTYVLTGVAHGGHSPVMVDLRIDGPAALLWQCPRPKPPPLLLLPSAALCSSTEWADLLVAWLDSPIGRTAMCPSISHTLESLSTALWEALHHLVFLAGGWKRRPPMRRVAYDSDQCRSLRRRLNLLHRLHSLLSHTSSSSPGAWPHSCTSTAGFLGCISATHLIIRFAQGSSAAVSARQVFSGSAAPGDAPGAA